MWNLSCSLDWLKKTLRWQMYNNSSSNRKENGTARNRGIPHAFCTRKQNIQIESMRKFVRRPITSICTMKFVKCSQFFSSMKIKRAVGLLGGNERNAFNFKSTHASFKFTITSDTGRGYPRCHKRCDAMWSTMPSHWLFNQIVAFEDISGNKDFLWKC